MEEYLTKMKTPSDKLSLAGSPASQEDLVSQVLSGLDTDYNPLVVYLSDKEDPSWPELHLKHVTF